MEFNRKIIPVLEERSRQFRIVTLTGPRQSGKTTLCKKVFPHKQYISLEDPDERRHCLVDPKSFLRKVSKGAILDEIQRVPEFLSYLQTYVDAVDEKGLFILTGSNQLALTESVAQSLAGRTALLQLLPLQFSEMALTSPYDWKIIALNGCYPGCIKDQIPAQVFYKSYYETYVEKDVRNLIQLKNLMLFDKLLKLLAARTGQILEYSSLAFEVGVSANTVKEWCSVLEASYVIFRLPPFFENLNKRLTKSPKMYFFDTGLLCYLLGIKTKQDLDTHPLRGFIFENFIAADLFKIYANKGESSPLYFYRDLASIEVDFIWKEANRYHLMELKSSMTYHPSFSKSLIKVDEILQTKKVSKIGANDITKTVVYDGASGFSEAGVSVAPWSDLLLSFPAI
jgi:predicted AAA+ superfamily ATPase